MNFLMGFLISSATLYVPANYFFYRRRMHHYKRLLQKQPQWPLSLWQYGTAWWEFPTFFMWHSFMDGTWVCNCTRSREMKDRKWSR